MQKNLFVNCLAVKVLKTLNVLIYFLFIDLQDFIIFYAEFLLLNVLFVIFQNYEFIRIKFAFALVNNPKLNFFWE